MHRVMMIIYDESVMITMLMLMMMCKPVGMVSERGAAKARARSEPRASRLAGETTDLKT